MGMAASQARFLALTARKNNIEYEGQQINQQRLNLSNQSASCYTQLLDMAVPTPPSVQDFTKTIYTFGDEDSGTKTILSMTKNEDPNYSYLVSYQQQRSEQVAQRYSQAIEEATIIKDLMSSGLSPKYTYNGVEITLLDPKNYPQQLVLTDDEKSLKDVYTYTDPQTNIIQYMLLDKTLQSQVEGNWLFKDVQHFKAAVTYEDDQETIQQKANIVQSANGQLTNITFKDGKSYSLTAKIVQDDTAYNEAMVKYEYEKAVYDKTIEDLNAQTAIIQEQDKSLELKLRQLDTEQKSLSTEMDAVKQVLQKNVESGFKTFS